MSLKRKEFFRFVLLISSGLIYQSVFAGTMGEQMAPSSSLVIALSSGPVWTNGGRTQTIYSQPEVVRTYAANNQTPVVAEGEVFAGTMRSLNNIFEGQFGVALATTSKARLAGNIWDDADPQFDNFIYNYKISHTHVTLKGKILKDMGHNFKPYISGSLGVGINRSSHFNNTPTIFEAVPIANFSYNTSTAFTYNLGIGLQRELTQHWQVGVGYEFADWGRTSLDRAPDQTLGNGLSLTHLYTNGLLFNLTYLA